MSDIFPNTKGVETKIGILLSLLIAGLVLSIYIKVDKDIPSRQETDNPTYVVEEIMVTGCEHVKDYFEDNLGIPSGKKQFAYTILLVSEDNDSLVIETKAPFMDSSSWIGHEVTVDTVRGFIKRK